MARIVIQDLQDSTELDRDAMRQVVGGRVFGRAGTPTGHFQRLVPGAKAPSWTSSPLLSDPARPKFKLP